MNYAVKEMFVTLQGEGTFTGRTSVFCRFAGCNLWSGREQDRGLAQCQFCDTDFVGTNGDGGGQFANSDGLARAIERCWPAEGVPHRFVVFTGGEPLLQLDTELIAATRRRGFEIALETNGTIPAPVGIDWLCVSPKAGTMLRQLSGNELKLVFPQQGVDPQDYVALDFKTFWLQPMDGPNRFENTQAAIAYCHRYPKWRLSVQMHKYIGIL